MDRSKLDRALSRGGWRLALCPCAALVFVFSFESSLGAQQVQTYSWQQLRDRFTEANPTLRAGKLNVQESREAEITAYLRPNPSLSLSTDGTQLAPYEGIYRPFSSTQVAPAFSYLHEREHKRELRRDQAIQSTAVAESSFEDQQRTLLFNLRGAFVQTLAAKAVLENARENMDYWDRELALNRTRFNAGDISQLDLSRLELQRVQFESDYETALVNLRTAKIQLLALLNDRTPIDQFDVTGTFDFTAELKPLEDFRNLALATRPDLKAASQNVELARITHQLAVSNGSTDPTYSFWITHNPSFNNPFANNTIGASVSIPLRIFDRNQGEKARTEIDVVRNERLRDASQSQVFSDVESAYWVLVQGINLLKPYKAKYLQLATEVRDRMAFSYRNGGSSLLEYQDAEKSYRDTRLAWLNLIGACLSAANQMNLAVGQEVIQ